MLKRAGLIVLALCIVTAGCATPGDQVKVPTMSVEDAWNNKSTKELAAPVSRIMTPSEKAPAPYPIITAPEVRLAYAKPWTDKDGVRHFGAWIAIQTESSKWVLPDGTLEPITSNSQQGQPLKKRF